MTIEYDLGEFGTVGTFAWQVYERCKDAPGSFQNISQDVLSLHAVLNETGELFSETELDAPRLQHLETIATGCRSAIEDLWALLEKYSNLGTESNLGSDRMQDCERQVGELRSRITRDIDELELFAK